MTIRIGYQGMEGSNSFEAAKNMAKRLNFKDVQLVPLLTSKNTIGALKRNEIDYAVVAIKNSIGGMVRETFEAIKNENLEQVCTEILPIKHALFKISPEIPNEEIRCIISHEQALKQCEQNIAKWFPNAETIAIEDTALGAKYLAEGIFDRYTAAICSLSAGARYNLYLEKAHMEDKSDNRTEFRMFKMAKPLQDKPSLVDLMIYHIVNDQGIGFITKTLMTVAIFLAFYIRDWMKWSTYDSALTLGGIIAGIFLFITSQNVKDWAQFRSIKGYWKYYSIPDNSNSQLDQRYETPRVVIIDEVDGQLMLKGWLCDNENVPLFQSNKTLISSLGKRNGNLVYWYSNPNQMSREFNLNGIVSLSWELKHPACKINRMSGWYMGKSTNEIGSLEYVRITEEEFHTLRKCDYL